METNLDELLPPSFGDVAVLVTWQLGAALVAALVLVLLPGGERASGGISLVMLMVGAQSFALQKERRAPGWMRLDRRKILAFQAALVHLGLGVVLVGVLLTSYSRELARATHVSSAELRDALGVGLLLSFTIGYLATRLGLRVGWQLAEVTRQAQSRGKR